MVKLVTKNWQKTFIVIVHIFIVTLLLLPLLAIDLWWLDNLANLQWQWSLAAGLLIVFNVFCQWRYRYIAITILTITVICQQGFLYKPQANHVLTKQTLTVAQFNISYDNQYLNELLPQFGDADFDVLVLQEASDQQNINFNILVSVLPLFLWP